MHPPTASGGTHHTICMSMNISSIRDEQLFLSSHATSVGTGVLGVRMSPGCPYKGVQEDMQYLGHHAMTAPVAW